MNVVLLGLTNYLDVDIDIGINCGYRYGYKLTFAKHFIVYKALSHTLCHLIWEGKCYYLHFIDEETKA